MPQLILCKKRKEKNKWDLSDLLGILEFGISTLVSVSLCLVNFRVSFESISIWGFPFREASTRTFLLRIVVELSRAAIQFCKSERYKHLQN